jgi:hypothetical protein
LDFGDERLEGCDVAGAELERRCLAAERFNLADEAFGFCEVAVVGDEDIHASAGEVESSVAAKAAAATGDEGDLTGLIHEASLLIMHWVQYLVIR